MDGSGFTICRNSDYLRLADILIILTYLYYKPFDSFMPRFWVQGCHTHLARWAPSGLTARNTATQWTHVFRIRITSSADDPGWIVRSASSRVTWMACERSPLTGVPDVSGLPHPKMQSPKGLIHDDITLD